MRRHTIEQATPNVLVTTSPSIVILSVTRPCMSNLWVVPKAQLCPPPLPPIGTSLYLDFVSTNNFKFVVSPK